jgi:cell division protein FtsB
MARERIAYRKKNQNRFSMILVSFVVLMILIVVAVRGFELQGKINEKRAEGARWDEMIADEMKQSEELDELDKEVQTKGYKEEVARDQLNLIYPDEIQFQEGQ